MTITGFIAFAQGWGGLYIRANRLAYQQLRKHPALGIPNPFGVPDVPERVHWDTDLARQVGTPGAYDYGPERASWLMHHLTDWMGDDGFLLRHRSQIRRHNAEGDRLAITGGSRPRVATPTAPASSRSPRERAPNTASCQRRPRPRCGSRAERE